MTLKEVESFDDEFLDAEDIAPFLGCNANDIRVQAHRQAEEGIDKLGFPVVIIGRRVRIPKVGFVNYIKFGRLVACGINQNTYIQDSMKEEV